MQTDTINKTLFFEMFPSYKKKKGETQGEYSKVVSVSREKTVLMMAMHFKQETLFLSDSPFYCIINLFSETNMMQDAIIQIQYSICPFL